MLPPEIAALGKLKDKDLLAEGLVVAEGRLLVLRLLEAARRSRDLSPGGLPRPRFEALALACVPSLAAELEPLAAGLCSLSVLAEAELALFAGYPFHRGVLGLGRRLALPSFDPSFLPPEGPSRLLLLPATVDPENLGSLIRCAAALGYAAVLTGPGSCDAFSRRALRVSMGAALGLPILPVADPGVLAELSSASYTLAAAVLDPAALDLAAWRSPERLCLLIGNEYEGLGQEWLPKEVVRLTIPMAGGTDSLNAAAAGAIFLYEAGRRT